MTQLDSISHDNDRVIVTLCARRSSQYKSLDATATGHFMDWQKYNWPRLKYKSSKVIDTISEDIPGDDDHYLYTVVVKLKF